MPRIYKGTETTLKLLIETPNNEVVDKIKIVLFTTDRNKAQEFYSDSITLVGNIAYVNVYEWTFVDMQDGVINYIAQGESDNKPFIIERQSNYLLKSTDEFQESDIMNKYYTKTEVDDKLEDEQDKLISGQTIKTINGESILGKGDIKVQVEGVTQDYVDEAFLTLEQVKQDNLVSGENIKTINGESILGEGNIEIQAGEEKTVHTFLIPVTKQDIVDMYNLYTAGEIVHVRHIQEESDPFQYNYESVLTRAEREYQDYGDDGAWIYRVDFVHREFNSGKAMNHFYRTFTDKDGVLTNPDETVQLQYDAPISEERYDIFNWEGQIRITNRDVLFIDRYVREGANVVLYNQNDDGYYKVVSVERVPNGNNTYTYKVIAFGNLGNNFPSVFAIQTWMPNELTGEILDSPADMATQQMLLTWQDAFGLFYRKNEIDETIGNINNILENL